MFNNSLYVLLFDRDFSALKGLFIAANDDWNRQFVGWQMAVMLYEGIQDLSKLFGHEFRQMLNDIGVSHQHRATLDAVRSRLAGFRRTHADRLKELRNVMAAHRDRDAMTQLRIVDNLHPLEVSLRTGGSFSVYCPRIPRNSPSKSLATIVGLRPALAVLVESLIVVSTSPVPNGFDAIHCWCAGPLS